MVDWAGRHRCGECIHRIEGRLKINVGEFKVGEEEVECDWVFIRDICGSWFKEYEIDSISE